MLLPKTLDTSCLWTVSLAVVAVLGLALAPSELNSHVAAKRLANDPRLLWFLSFLLGVSFGVDAPEAGCSVAVEVMECVGEVPSWTMLATREEGVD